MAPKEKTILANVTDITQISVKNSICMVPQKMDVKKGMIATVGMQPICAVFQVEVTHVPEITAFISTIRIVPQHNTRKTIF